MLEFDANRRSPNTTSELSNYAFFLVYQCLDHREWQQIHWHFLQKTYLLSRLIGCLRGASTPASVKIEATLVLTCFVENCKESQLSQWLVLELGVLEILSRNLSAGVTATTQELDRVTLDLIEQLLDSPSLNQINPNIAHINLPKVTQDSSSLIQPRE